ncbi:MAG: hypothetical protein K8R60_07505 [Burkholderiales bacterium]|nr:hypothetical protein [Burkholderiales bacterium]
MSTLPARTARIGGAPEEELLSRLQGAGVLLNDAARALFADGRFMTSSVSSLVEAVEVSPTLASRAGRPLQRWSSAPKPAASNCALSNSARVFVFVRPHNLRAERA